MRGGDLRVVRRHPWLAALFALALALALYYALIPIVHPPAAEVCAKGEYGPPDQCAYYDVVSAAIVRTFHFADDHNGLFTAVAGLMVAVFTYVLWRSTEKLWIAGERQAALTRQLFDAENRPWIGITAIALTRFEFDTNTKRWRYGLDVQVQNSGKSPAAKVWVFPRFLGPDERGSIDMAGENRKLVTEVLEGITPIYLFGETVFPGTPPHTMRPLVYIDETEGRRTQYSGVIIGCVLYRGASLTTKHITTFSLGISNDVDKDARWPSEGDTIAADQYRITICALNEGAI